MFVLSLLISGCWDYHELDDETVISIFAYDVNSSHQLLASAYLQTPQQKSDSNSGSGTGTSKPEILQAVGKTMFEAIKNLSTYSPNQLAFHHHIISILSEEFARSRHFGNGLERITRVGATRRRGLFAITSGNAFEVLRIKLPPVDDLSQGLSKLLEESKEQQYSIKMDMNDFLYDLTTTGIEPILPRIVLVSGKSLINKKPELKIFGSGAFRGTHFVGWLSGTETRGVLWLRGKSGHPLLKFPWKDGEIIVQTEDIQAKIIPPKQVRRIKQRLSFQISAQWQGEIVMYTGHRILSIQDIPSIQQGVVTQMKPILKQSIIRAQALHSDVIGFGNAFYCVHPRIYRVRYLDQWNDVYFPKITYSFQVKAKILSIGMTSHAPENGR